MAIRQYLIFKENIMAGKKKKAKVIAEGVHVIIVNDNGKIVFKPKEEK